MDAEQRWQWYELGVELGVLTEKQQRALRIWSTGAGYGRIADILGLSKEGARGHVRAGLHNVRRALREQAVA